MAKGSSARIAVAAGLAIFVFGVASATLGTLMPALTFLNTGQKGVVALTQALGLALASLFAGPLIDHTGKKIALLSGLTPMSAALYALPHAGNYPMVLVCFFALGFGGGMLGTASNALASDIGRERRASTLNFLNSFFALGGFTTPLVAANLLHGDAAALCYVAAGLTAAVLVIHAATPMPQRGRQIGFRFSEVGAVLQRPALWLLGLYIFLYVACEVGTWNWLASYLLTQGVSKSDALNIVSFGFALGLLIGRVSISRVLIRVKPAVVTVVAPVFMAGTTYWMLHSHGTGLAWMSVFCAGLAMAPVYPTTISIIGDEFPVMTATAMSVVITFGWLGLAISSPIIGSIAGAGSANLKTALLLLPAFSITMLFLNLAVRPLLKSTG